MKEDFYLPTSNKKEGLKKTYPSFIVLAVSLILVIIFWRMLTEQVNERIGSLYQSEKKIITEKIRINLDKKIDILKSFQSLYDGKVQIVRDVFELYATVPQKMNKDIIMIGFAPNIKRGMESGFLENARNEGYSDYSITPAASKPEYYPVSNYLPYKQLMKVVGFDLSSDPVKEEGIKQSVEKSEIRMAAVSKSVFSDAPVLMLVAPVKFGYGAEIAPNSPKGGICFMEMGIKEFVDLSLGVESSSLAYDIYDGTEKNKNSLIFSKSGDDSNLRMSDEVLDLAGRKWTIHFTTLKIFASDVNKEGPLYVLIIGVFISILLFGFTYSLLTSRSRAQELADRMTRSQRRIMDASQDIIGAIDLKGLWKFLNPASGKIFGTDPYKLIGQSIYEMIHPAHKSLVESVIYDSPDEKANQFEAAFITKRGDIKWLSWSITLSQKDQLVYMIGRDITEKRKDDEILKARSRQIDVARILTERENYQNEKFRKEQSLVFRTELTSTLGFLSIILAESENLNEDQKTFVENARASAEGVLNAVKNVLDVSYAKLSDVTFNVQEVNASELLNTVKELTSTGKFETKLPDTLTLRIEIDKNKLKYALDNIKEALFRLNPGAQLKVTVFENKDDGIIEIEFFCPGATTIPDLFRKTIIEEPETSNLFDNTEEFNIFISKEFIEVMNGSIGVINDGKGLRVSIMFYENI